ncbi:MAG: DUF2236 domain-containing protein [Alphaproteobacteria bacterium]|nr:DUF2236 domain-containing protein [Alphaproteobacteria bacterium]MDE2112849.1 DUF2236 domain-containing protein [Alphaproteobacteria bacterium]MDE2494809.1 DUF2236 domain-containing protein [Alphaproteobacteria bacterium]
MSALTLPPLLQRRLDAAALALLYPPNAPEVDFTQPRGEPALIPPDSVSWRIFKNPVSLFVGGVAAVILELAEPRVRTGVWEHSSFRTDPVKRLQRTGMAAMITVYGARSVAEKMIAGVVRLHDKVRGKTPAGESYRANDVELLTWVQATASFGFAEAYNRYVRPLGDDERNRAYAEALLATRLYGAAQAPASEAELLVLFDAMRERLEPSPIIFEFLKIMRTARVFPAPLQPLQRLLVGAAVEMTPDWARRRLSLTPNCGLRSWEKAAVCVAGRLADNIVLRTSPAVQSCLRLGLPENHLYSF